MMSSGYPFNIFLTHYCLPSNWFVLGSKDLHHNMKLEGKVFESILENMKKFQIDFMNTKNGKLTYATSKRKEPLNKKNLITGLNNYFNNEDESNFKDNLIILFELIIYLQQLNIYNIEVIILIINNIITLRIKLIMLKEICLL